MDVFLKREQPSHEPLVTRCSLSRRAYAFFCLERSYSPRPGL